MSCAGWEMGKLEFMMGYLAFMTLKTMLPFTAALVTLHHIWFFLTTTQKSKLIIMILSLPFENAFTLHNVRIYNKSVFNKDQNQYYYNRFWEKCSYKSAKKSVQQIYLIVEQRWDLVR